MNAVTTVALCQCGCGNPAPIAQRTYKNNGVRKGQPFRFIKGHTWGGKKLSEAHREHVSNGLKIVGHRPTSEAIAKGAAINRQRRGEAHQHWGGGRTVNSKGYIEVYRPDHPHAMRGGYVYEHRLVMEGVLGRYLLPTEDVHHRNHLKTDNHAENLEVLSRSEHSKRHREESAR